MGLRREDHPDAGALGELPWLDRPDAREAIEARLEAGELSEEQAGWLRDWVRKGWVSFDGILERELADAINADVDAVLEANRHLPHGELIEKFKNVYVHSEATRRAITLPAVYERLDLILGREVFPHQTLNLPLSSQQGAHSDEILMTTHPPGFMAAAWFALEDIQPDSGPLILFTGSHRLPYVSAREVGIPRGVDEAECARVYDGAYYDIVRARIEEHGLEPYEHVPRLGSVLFWHSNILHGARLATRPGATRKSLIAHYFARDTVQYSDLFQRPCLSPDLRPGVSPRG